MNLAARSISKNKTKTNQGVTLIEIGVVIAVIVAVLAGAITALPVAIRTYNVYQVNRNVGEIIAAVNVWRVGKSSYTGLDKDALKNAGLVQSNTFSMPWGGDGTGDETAISINVPTTGTGKEYIIVVPVTSTDTSAAMEDVQALYDRFGAQFAAGKVTYGTSTTPPGTPGALPTSDGNYSLFITLP